MRRLFTVALALAGLAGIASAGLAAGAGTPAAAVRTYFQSIVVGDLAKARSVSDGKARQELQDPRSSTFKHLKVAAMAFKSVTDVKIKGNKATALAHMDPYVIAELMYEQYKHRLKTEKQRRLFRKNVLEAAKKKLSTFKMVLLKRGGGWIVMGYVD